MNDKSITITIKANASQFQSVMKAAGQTLDGASAGGKKSLGMLQASAVAAGTLIARAFEQIVRAVANNIGDAVKRVDILNNFPKVMSNVGIGTDTAREAIKKLSDRLQGLPTSLDTAAQSVQGLTMKTKDVNKATDIFLAFNNALLAGGAPMERQSQIAIQFSQAFAKGKPDLIEWRAMMEGMPAQMDQLAKSFGQVDALSLYDQIKDGNITMDDFAQQLVKLNSKGVDGLPGFAEQAKNATGGIQTNMANMQTAITRGIAKVIEAIGSKNIADAISGIGKAFETALTFIADNIPKAVDAIKSFLGYISDHKDVFAPIAVGIGAVVAAITAWKTAILIWSGVTKAAAAVQAAFNAVMAMNPITLIVLAVIGLVAALVYFFTKTETGKKIVQAAFKAIGSALKVLGDVFKNIFNFIIGVWNGIADFFKGLWDGVMGVFNGIVDFIKEWGLTILAVIFWPFSLAIGLIIANWETISAFFGQVWEGIKAVFTPVINFFKGVFEGAWNAIKAVWDFVVAYYTTLWKGIVAVFSVVGTFFKDMFTNAWNAIVKVFTPIVDWFGNKFRDAWNGIKAIFGAVGGFFKGVWDTITGTFGKIGKAVGDAVGGAFKNVVNSIIGFAENTVNGFIKAINGAIGIINKIPGVKIPLLGELKIPRMKDGGILGGNSYTGDKQVFAGNTGEMVINRQDQNALWSAIKSGDFGGGQSSPSIVLQSGSSLVNVQFTGDPRSFSDDDAITIGKMIQRALNSQGLTINEMGALR